MPQPRIRPQRAQQRVLQHVLGVLVAGQLARVHEQLVAVSLDEAPERGQRNGRHMGCNAARRDFVSATGRRPAT